MLNYRSMNAPPKIMETPVKEIAVEVLPPERAGSIPHRTAAEGPPIHALSALLLVAVDSLWVVFDFAPPIWIIAIPFCFLTVLIPSFLIQKHLKRNSNGRALAFASLLAVLAAIPTPITGTPIGLGLLAWTGLGKILGKSAPK